MPHVFVPDSQLGVVQDPFAALSHAHWLLLALAKVYPRPSDKERLLAAADALTPIIHDLLAERPTARDLIVLTFVSTPEGTKAFAMFEDAARYVDALPADPVLTQAVVPTPRFTEVQMRVEVVAVKVDSGPD